MRDRTSAAPPELPLLQLLGPVELVNPRGQLSAGRTPSELREVVAAVYLQPGISTTRLARILGRQARDIKSLVSRTRRWIGTDPQTGSPILTSGGQYNLEGLHSDWAAFNRLRGDRHDTDHLVGALELVRDRPLGDIPAGRWAWADQWLEDTIDAIVETAHTLANQTIASGNLDTASWAARRGRLADPYTEILGRDELRIAQAAGQWRRFHNITERIVETARMHGGGLAPETRQLLAQLDNHAGPNNSPPDKMEHRLRRTA